MCPCNWSKRTKSHFYRPLESSFESWETLWQEEILRVCLSPDAGTVLSQRQKQPRQSTRVPNLEGHPRVSLYFPNSPPPVVVVWLIKVDWWVSGYGRWVGEDGGWCVCVKDASNGGPVSSLQGSLLSGAFSNAKARAMAGKRLSSTAVPCKEQPLRRAFFLWEFNRSPPTFFWWGEAAEAFQTLPTLFLCTPGTWVASSRRVEESWGRHS